MNCLNVTYLTSFVKENYIDILYTSFVFFKFDMEESFIISLGWN